MTEYNDPVFDHIRDALLLLDGGGVQFANKAALDFFGVDDSADILENMYPEDREKLLRAVEGVTADAAATGETLSDLRCVSGDSDRTFSARLSVSRHRGEDAVAVLLQDTASESLFQRHIIAERNLALKLARSSDLSEALEYCLETACELTLADSAAVYLVNRDTGNLELEAHRGFGEKMVEASRVMLKGSPEWRMVMTGEAAYADFRELGVGRVPDILREKLRGVAVLPIVAKGEVIGSFNLASHEQTDIVPVHRGSIENIAAQVGSAIMRLKAESELRRSEERLHNTLNAMDDLVFTLDADGVFVYTHEPRGAQSLLMSPERYLGRHYRDVIPFDLANRFTKAIRESAASGEAVEFDYTLEIAGEARWFTATVTRLSGSNEERPGTLVVVRDVTARKRTEQALRVVRNRAQEYLNIAGTILVALDENGHLTLINRKGCSLLGYEEEELIGEQWFKHVAPERYRPMYADEFRKVMEGRTVPVDSYQTVVLTRNGEERMIHWRSTVLWDDQDRPVGLLSSGEDVTDRVQRELQERRLSELRQVVGTVLSRFIGEESPEAVIDRFLRDLGEQFDVSRAYLFRYRENGTLMDNTHEWCAGDVEPQIASLQGIPTDFFPWWQEQMEQGRMIRINDLERDNVPQEVVGILSEQDIKGLLVTPIYVFGELYGFLGFDETRVSRRWRDEEVTLAQTVAESFSRALERRRREQELKEADVRLRAEAVRAEQANRAKTDFLANVSHEIRTPMSAIIGYVDMIRETSPEAGDVENLTAAIRRNADHLLSLVNDVLDLSKVEAGEIRMDAEPCNLVDMVDQVAAVMRARAQEKNLLFNVDYNSPLPQTIMTDPLRFRQILINLTGNAVKFTDEGEVRIEVSARPSAARPGRLDLLVRVHDTGIGIPEEKQEMIFQPFSRIVNRDRKQREGTGLGLSLSQKLAHILGGRIEVTSREGVGSDFVLVLDAGRSSEIEMVGTPGIRPKSSSLRTINPASTLQGTRVLLVEDGPDNQMILSHYLKRAGVELDVAEDGLEGLKAVETAIRQGRPHDVILMDMMMPVMDGYQATRELRRQGLTMPIIALTAYAMVDDRNKTLQAGCSDYLSKPVEPAHFYQVIARHLGRSMVPPEQTPPRVMPASTAPDGDNAVSTLMDDPDLVPLVQRFVEGLPEIMVAIREAMAGGEWNVVRDRAHQLKGSGASFGFQGITRAAGACEQALRTEDEDTIGPNTEALIAMLDRVIEANREVFA